MELYPLIFTNFFCIIPIIFCFKNYNLKRKKNHKSLFVIFNLFFSSIFSSLFHTYNYDNIKLDISNYNTWSLLDYVFANSTIFIVIIYILNLKSNKFYLYTYINNSFLIFFYMISDDSKYYIGYYTITTSLFIGILNIFMIIDYFKKYFFNSLLVIITIILAIYFSLFHKSNYYITHSLWHVLIHLSGGIACYTKNKYDISIIENNNNNNIV